MGGNNFFVGVGTARVGLRREEVWSDDEFMAYREFFNILAAPGPDGLTQHEKFHAYHDDWRNRLTAPYWLFDEGRTHFNLRNPLHVATYRRAEGALERWRSAEDDLVRRLERLLFVERGIGRRLRTTNPQISHPHIRLSRSDDPTVARLQGDLLGVCEEAARRLEPVVRTVDAPTSDGVRRAKWRPLPRREAVPERTCTRCYEVKPQHLFVEGANICRECA